MLKNNKMETFLETIKNIPNIFKIAHIFARDDVFDIIEMLQMMTITQIHEPIVREMLIKDNSLTADYICRIINASINTESHKIVTDNCKITVISENDDIYLTFLYMNGNIIYSDCINSIKNKKIDKSELTKILEKQDMFKLKELFDIDANIASENTDSSEDEISIDIFDITNYNMEYNSIIKQLKSLTLQVEEYINTKPKSYFLQLFSKNTTPNDLHITIYYEDPCLEQSITIAKSKIYKMYSYIKSCE